MKPTFILIIILLLTSTKWKKHDITREDLNTELQELENLLIEVKGVNSDMDSIVLNTEKHLLRVNKLIEGKVQSY